MIVFKVVTWFDVGVNLKLVSFDIAVAVILFCFGPTESAVSSIFISSGS